MFEIFINFLIVIGFYTLCCYLYDNLKSPALILRNFIKKYFNEGPVETLREKYGEWAAITGASDGIGREYARELARQGLNIVLISRTESKLNQVAENIEQEFGVRTKIIVVDFSQGRSVYEKIEKGLNELRVGVLVNNVGQNVFGPAKYTTYTTDEVWSIMNTNICAVTELSHYFLKRMHETGVKGAIVNISSGTELLPVPYGALYGASKAYTRSLTLALQEEARRYGTTIQLVSPGFVVTKMNSYSKFIMRGNFMMPSASAYARWAVSTLGITDETTGYFWHGVQCAILKWMPWQLRYQLALFYIRVVTDNFSP